MSPKILNFFVFFFLLAVFIMFSTRKNKSKNKADAEGLCVFRHFPVVYVLQNHTFNNFHVMHSVLHLSLNWEALCLFCSLRCGQEDKLKDGFEGRTTVSKGGSGKEQVEMQKVEEEEEVQERKEKWISWEKKTLLINNRKKNMKKSKKRFCGEEEEEIQEREERLVRN